MASQACSVPLVWNDLQNGALLGSWLVRSSPPNDFLPSKLLREYIKALPLAIPILILGALIDHWFGREAFVNVIFIVGSLFITFGLWFIPYVHVTTHLEKRKKKYNAVLVGVLTSIPSLAFLALCVRGFFLFLVAEGQSGYVSFVGCCYLTYDTNDI